MLQGSFSGFAKESIQAVPFDRPLRPLRPADCLVRSRKLVCPVSPPFSPWLPKLPRAYRNSEEGVLLSRVCPGFVLTLWFWYMYQGHFIIRGCPVIGTGTHFYQPFASSSFDAAWQAIQDHERILKMTLADDVIVHVVVDGKNSLLFGFEERNAQQPNFPHRVGQVRCKMG